MYRCTCLTLLVLAGVAHAEPTKPNIVLIFIDDMGYTDIGTFGNTVYRTPNLDRFAKEGMKFTSFYATPVCSMSRASLLTGCYNTRVSIPGVLFPKAKIGLHPDEITLADLLKTRGYATTCIGKWHLGHLPAFLPTKQGFDTYFGLPYSNDMALDPDQAVFAKDCLFREGYTAESARAKPVPNTVPLMRGSEIVEYPAEQATLTRRYTDEAIAFIEKHQTEPFFVYLPHTMVHFPLAASPEFKGKSKGGLIGDAIEELDANIGRLMQTLKDRKLDENTLVIFTSDNGPANRSAAPLRGNKTTVFEGGVREPCIMRWPGKIPANTTCPHIAGNIDVLPTFAALSGAKLPDGRTIDGRDLSPMLFDAKAGPVRDVHLYFNGASQLAAIREKNWKLFPKGLPATKKAKEPVDTTPALYDLSVDVGETKNVAAEHPEIVARLTAEAQTRGAEIEKNKRPAGTVSE